MADLFVHPCCLEPPFTETSLHVGHLHLLLKEIDLTAERLALFVHHMVPVDLSHETPIVDCEFVKLAMDCGKGGATPSQGG